MLVNYSHFQNYILRTPKNPLKFGFSLLLKNKFPMSRIIEDTSLMETLYLASPELTKALKNYKKLEGNKKSKLDQTVLKYLVRSASRCTPFGLFSGCAIGTFDTNTHIGNIKEVSRYTSLDMDVLIEISKKLMSVHKIKESTNFLPNTSLYKIGCNYRYIESNILNKSRTYTLENVSQTNYLEKVFDFSFDGKKIFEIVYFLYKTSMKQEDNLTTDEISDFVDELILNQLLIPEISPSITGRDYLDKLIAHTKSTIPTHSYNKLLTDIYIGLKELDFNILNSVDKYEKIINEINNFSLSKSDTHLFQTDYIQNFEYNTLTNAIPAKALKAMEVLHKISTNNPRIYLEEFKRHFIQKYGCREVPLASVFDKEIGIEIYGENNYNEFDLIPDLQLGISMDSDPKVVNKDILRFFQLKYAQVLNNDLKVMEITDSDLSILPEQEDKSFSNTFSALIEVYNNDDKKLIFLSSAGGSTAINLIARFSQQSSDVATLMQQIIEKENTYNTDSFLAEICHFPDNRTGNILKSKVNRPFEIVYLSNSEKPIKNQIFINDLFITVQDNNIKLRSKRLNKQIIPILSNAHNFYDNSLPIYKFLCELQFQHKKETVAFQWPKHFSNFKFLPRIQYKDFILSKAKWNIMYTEIANLTNLNNWRVKRGIPQFIQIVEHDNHLLLNLENLDCVEILKKQCKKNKEIMVLEFLFSPNKGLKINNDFYANEFILFYYKNSDEAA